MRNNIVRKYDVVILNGVLEHLMDLHVCMEEFVSYFKPDGMLLHDAILDDVPLYGLSKNSFTLWKYEEENTCADFNFDDLERYLDSSKKFAGEVKKRFQGFDLSKGFYIWGAGTQTVMLYQLHFFLVDKVKGIVDSNVTYLGNLFMVKL